MVSNLLFYALRRPLILFLSLCKNATRENDFVANDDLENRKKNVQCKTWQSVNVLACTIQVSKCLCAFLFLRTVASKMPRNWNRDII